VRLIETLLQAGYLEDWRYHATLSGCPQGSIVSPVLANIYLDKLDTFVETELLPVYSRGHRDEERTQPMHHCRRVHVASGERGSGNKLDTIVVRCNSFLLLSQLTLDTGACATCAMQMTG
jgi:hypothetical protein